MAGAGSQAHTVNQRQIFLTKLFLIVGKVKGKLWLEAYFPLHCLFPLNQKPIVHSHFQPFHSNSKRRTGKSRKFGPNFLILSRDPNGKGFHKDYLALFCFQIYLLGNQVMVP